MSDNAKSPNIRLGLNTHIDGTRRPKGGPGYAASAPMPDHDRDRDLDLDLLGIGLGPFNLSVACLATSVPRLSTHFLEQRPDNSWHPQLLFTESDLQVSFLKDLVSLVDPTNRFSFLNFLVHTGRIHRFASLPEVPVSRWEFAQYYAWAAGLLPNVEFERCVISAEFSRGAFQVHTTDGLYTAKNLSVGIGLESAIPECARAHLGPRVLHSSGFLSACERMAGKRVAIVGGGQSGAEVFAHLMDLPIGLRPASLAWITRRSNFAPLDDSAFTNEFFHPDYVRYFHRLAPQRRETLLREQQMASDGISSQLVRRIYRRLYENDFADSSPIRCRLLPGHVLQGMSVGKEGCRLELLHQDMADSSRVLADIVVLATGYQFALPRFLEPLADRLPAFSQLGLPLQEDYSVPWAGPEDNRLYFLNAGRHSHGIADPNLSLASWRAAKVLNSVVGEEHFPVALRTSTCDWSGRLGHSKTAAGPWTPFGGSFGAAPVGPDLHRSDEAWRRA